jgi:hypothetical protein
VEHAESGGEGQILLGPEHSGMTQVCRQQHREQNEKKQNAAQDVLVWNIAFGE